MSLTEKEMFEESFKRPKNFLNLNSRQQWDIDEELGILDWKGKGLTKEDKKRWYAYFKGGKNEEDYSELL